MAHGRSTDWQLQMRCQPDTDDHDGPLTAFVSAHSSRSKPDVSFRSKPDVSLLHWQLSAGGLSCGAMDVSTALSRQPAAAAKCRSCSFRSAPRFGTSLAGRQHGLPSARLTRRKLKRYGFKLDPLSKSQKLGVPAVVTHRPTGVSHTELPDPTLGGPMRRKQRATTSQ